LNFLNTCRKISKEASETLSTSTSEEVGENPLGQKTMKVDVDLERVILNELKKQACIVASEEMGLKSFSKSPKHLFVVDPLDASENYKRGMKSYVLGIARARPGSRLCGVEEAYIYDFITGDEFYSHKGKGAWRNEREMRASEIKDISEAILAIDFYRPGAKPVSDSTRAKALKYSKDIRRYGPALLEMAYVACGSLEGYLNLNMTLSTVHACGPALMKHAGCIVTNEKGEELEFGLENVNEYFTIVAGANREIHEKMLEIARG